MNNDQYMTNDQLIAKTAIALLDESTAVTGFKMSTWTSYYRDENWNYCLTSCCVMGHAVMIRDCLNPKEGPFVENRAQELSALFPSFIWASPWSNDREQAATRILFYLEKNPIVDQFDGSEYHYYKVPSDLRERLEKFLP